MKLIIGLGNPGQKYEHTRHNLGWQVLDQLSQNWKENKKFNALIDQNQDMVLAKPLTFMNNSGESVKKIADYFKIETKDIIVVHDDIDLELGQIKIQTSRGSAGHKGIESIFNHLKSKDFTRIRIGIKPAKDIEMPTEKFVLEKFDQQERKILDQTIKKAARLIRTAASGAEIATPNNFDDAAR